MKFEYFRAQLYSLFSDSNNTQIIYVAQIMKCVKRLRGTKRATLRESASNESKRDQRQFNYSASRNMCHPSSVRSLMQLRF